MYIFVAHAYFSLCYLKGAPSPQIRPARDLPCVAVLSTFLNFLFAFALIAVMCALRQRSVDVPGVLASGLETIALSNSGTDPLAVVRLAVSVFRRHAAYANLAITGEKQKRIAKLKKQLTRSHGVHTHTPMIHSKWSIKLMGRALEGNMASH